MPPLRRVAAGADVEDRLAGESVNRREAAAVCRSCLRRSGGRVRRRSICCSGGRGKTLALVEADGDEEVGQEVTEGEDGGDAIRGCSTTRKLPRKMKATKHSRGCQLRSNTGGQLIRPLDMVSLGD